VEDQIRAEDEIKRAEQYEALKQSLLRLLDDPQVQQKIVILLRRWLKVHIQGNKHSSVKTHRYGDWRIQNAGNH
jgi:hypothetical protein